MAGAFLRDVHRNSRGKRDRAQHLAARLDRLRHHDRVSSAVRAQGIALTAARPAPGRMAARISAAATFARPAKSLQAAGRLAGRQQARQRFRLRSQQFGLRFGLFARFILQHFGDLHKLQALLFRRPAEPFVQIAVQHVYAEQHHEEHRHDAQGQRADDAAWS